MNWSHRVPTTSSGVRVRLTRSVSAVLACSALLLSAAACDGGGSPTNPDLMTAEVAGISAPSLGKSTAGVSSVSPSLATIDVGRTIQVVAVDAYGNPVSATWSTSNSAVATVSSSGLVRGVAAGEATITAKTRRQSASARITVKTPTTTTPPPTTPDTATSDTTTTGTTTPGTTTPPPTAPGDTGGVWISRAKVATLPMSGPAWTNLKATADTDCGTPNLVDQDQNNNVCVMAKALVFARTGTASYRADVVRAIQAIVASGTYAGRALALGRELAAYVIAADLIDLAHFDPALDTSFRTRLHELRTAYTADGPDNLILCHEERPNNWGTHCGASRIAVAVYLGDRTDLDRAARVFRGWLGDRATYAGFRYGTDLSWQCDESRPVGINPAGCVKNGVSLDGVVPDDQRRGSSFTWPAPQEPYVYEALQGALAQALMLSRQGYDVWNWQDRALLRAFRWLHERAGYAATGDDTWQPHLVNHVYGTSFPAPDPARPGKNVGWTDWTH